MTRTTIIMTNQSRLRQYLQCISVIRSNYQEREGADACKNPFILHVVPQVFSDGRGCGFTRRRPDTTTERLEFDFRHAHRANHYEDREKHDGDAEKYGPRPLCRTAAVFCQPKVGSTNHRRIVLCFSLWGYFLNGCMEPANTSHKSL